MVKSIVLAAGLALLAAIPEAAIADTVFNYAVNGFENASGTINPLTGFIDVDATSSNTGTITGYDLFTNGKEFNFSGLTSQIAGPGEYVLQGKSVGGSGATIELVLDTTSSLFSGLTTTIDSASSGIAGEGAVAGTLTVAPVPGPVLGAGLPGLMMAIGGFLAWRRRKAVFAT